MIQKTVLGLTTAVLVAGTAYEAAAEGFPKLIDPTADLGAQTPGPELGWADSIYITSRLEAGGHDIGTLPHVVSIPNGPGRKIIYSITDESTGFYRYEVIQVTENDFQWSKDGLTSPLRGSPGPGMRKR